MMALFAAGAFFMFAWYGSRALEARGPDTPFQAAREEIEADNTLVGLLGGIRRVEPLEVVGENDPAGVSVSALAVGSRDSARVHLDLAVRDDRWTVVRASARLPDGRRLPLEGAGRPRLEPASPSAVSSARGSTPLGPTSARFIAVTVDDLPVAPPGRHSTEQQAVITKRLLETLAEHGVPAIGFVNESKLEVGGVVDPDRVALLERWLDAGLELGNHGYAHLDLHEVSPELWLEDILHGERVTRPLVEGRGGELRWFRHPFLHTGRTEEIQSRVAAFLGAHGYRIAPVTIDNGEWIYGGAYARAWNGEDDEAMERLGRDYLRYMLEVVEYHEGLSAAVLGRQLPQVLLIHAYALNADWLDELLERLEARGYRWVSLADALEDPAYDRSIAGYTGSEGITWLQRWALTEGLGSSIFRGEPEVPAWVVEASR